MMYLKFLALLSLFVLNCCAQEQLTCLRSTTSSSGASILANDNTRGRMQGPPGKRGVMGEKGWVGEKGNKGEPGIPDNAVLEELREEIATLRRQVETRQTTTMETSTATRPPLTRLDDGWIGLSNGYQYKLSSERQNYEASRRFCKSNEADLAVYGIRDIEIRKMIRGALRAGDMYIGMNDISSEGNWRWINGNRVSDGEALWGHSGQPDGGTRSNCAVVSSDFRSYDISCIGSYQALCEKRWN